MRAETRDDRTTSSMRDPRSRWPGWQVLLPYDLDVAMLHGAHSVGDKSEITS